MKTDRRQQLRTNELAQSLADLVEFLRRNSGAVFAGTAAIVLVVGLGIYWYSARVAAHYQGWDDFYGSQLMGERSSDARLAAMRTITERYKDPALVAMTWVKLADASLHEATSGTRSPEEVQRLFTDAANAYSTILQHYPDQLLAVAGAHFGLAYLAENQGQWDVASRHYQAVIEDARFAEMPYKQEATEALKRLAVIREPIVFAPPPATSPATQSRSDSPPRSSGPAASVPIAGLPGGQAVSRPVKTSTSSVPAVAH